MGFSVSDKIKTISNVLLYIENHKFELVNELFPSSGLAYKSEWYARETVKFWQHLDLGNAAEVVRLAEAFYAKEGN